jgi:hypothetical protein
MFVTEISPAEKAAIAAEVERLAQSSILHGSEALCRLLKYLADQFLAHPGIPVKEYQLAVEVFGRPTDFDPRMDSTVRVQTGRLRSKVAEYYASAGNEDVIVLEIPKGSYSLSFHRRPQMRVEAAPAPELHIVNRTMAPAETRPNGLVPVVWTLAVVSGILAAVLIWGWYRDRAPKPQAQAASPAPESVRRFWAPFTQSDQQPWVIFSNAEFIGKPQVGIRYFDPARDSRADILDHYTGVGEVLAVAQLSRLFSQMGHDMRIKRGRLLSLDDVKNDDMIFIGSPAENLTLREITTTQDFVFRRIGSGERKGDVEIVNVHPRQGEPKTFLGSKSLPIDEDYGLIGLVPGINPARWVLVLAGTTTMGTQAAAEFVCREHDLTGLLNRLPSRGGAVSPFEAVIRVRISSGVPVNSTLVVLHAPGGHQD